MIFLTLGVLLTCHAALGFPGPAAGPYPGPRPGPQPGPLPQPRAAPGPGPQPLPAPSPDPNYYGGLGYGYGGYGFGGYGLGGYGCGEVITPPVSPPVLNTVDVYDIATLGVIPAPPIEYVYPAVSYEAFGYGYDGGVGGYGYPGLGPGLYGQGLVY